MRASTYPLIDAEVAAALVLERTHFLGAERVPLMDCAGRVLAEDIVAADPLPAFPSSAVDGYALRAAGDGGVEVGKTPGRGQIPDSNRWALLAALREAGAEVRLLGIGPDEPDALRRLVVDALTGADVLVTSGGVSVGTHDLIKPLLESIGDVHVGRVKLKPGKPFTFATLPEDKVAFGLPGFPVSSLGTFEVFVRPALRKMQGFGQLQRPTLPVRPRAHAPATAHLTEYQRCHPHPLPVHII